jgi:hypothetical protein
MTVAISLMAGELASTVLSRMAVAVLYYMSERGGKCQQNVTSASAQSICTAIAGARNLGESQPVLVHVI